MTPDQVLTTSIFTELLDNSALCWGLIACGVAQTSKLLFELVIHQKWRPSVLIETGGMPSSHSALVTATASGVGLQLGFSHPTFALAATIAFVVMYDASGIRLSSGLMAARINQLPADNWPLQPEKPLKESLGHSRLEVLVGSLLGPAIALPGIIFIGSPLHYLELLHVF